jgi:hypothetical protein
MKKRILHLVLVIAACLSAQAVTIVDPPLVTGANAIDPAGEQTLDQDAAGAASEATLEALPGFAAIQNFPGWSIQGTTNYIVFTTDSTRADVRSTYGGMTGGSPGGGTSSPSLRTSPGTSIGLDSGSTRTATLTLDFGSATYDGTTVTAFDATSIAPTAVGFSVCGLSNVTTNVTVRYYGTDDTTVLSTQTLIKATDPDVADGTTFGSDGYTAYQATGTGIYSGIGRIVVTANQLSSGSNGIAIDDLAYNSAGKIYYMTVSGAGTLDGSSWANALPASQLGTTLNTTMIGGDTLLLGSGNYGNRTIALNSSGTAGKPKSVTGVDTGTGIPIFNSNNWTRTNPGAGQYAVITLGTGASHWNVSNLALRNCQFAVRANGSSPARTNLSFKDLDIQLVRHGFYLHDCDNMTIENCSITSYSKHAYRLEWGCDNVTFKNCLADLSAGDATWWDYSEALPYGFLVNNGGAANTMISFMQCSAYNNRLNNQTIDYWNGDGFVVEGNTSGVSFLDCVAVNNEDAGYDIKAAATFENCTAVRNHRGFRCWNTTKTLTNCVAAFPFSRSISSPNGYEGGDYIWIENGTATLDYFSSYGNNGTVVREDGTGNVTLTNSILAFSGASGGFTAGSVTLGSGTVTYRPGSGTNPNFLNPVSTWDGTGTNMDNTTYGLTKGYNSTR